MSNNEEIIGYLIISEKTDHPKVVFVSRTRDDSQKYQYFINIGLKSVNNVYETSSKNVIVLDPKEFRDFVYRSYFTNKYKLENERIKIIFYKRRKIVDMYNLKTIDKFGKKRNIDLTGDNVSRLHWDCDGFLQRMENEIHYLNKVARSSTIKNDVTCHVHHNYNS